VQAYQAGASIRQLTTRFGVHKETARAHLERAGVERRPGNSTTLTAEDERVMCELYQDGWSLRRLGEHFHVTDNTVLRVLRQHQVVTRPPGRPRKR